MSSSAPAEQQSTLTSLRLGGDERNRTAGLLLARQALSHLSYTPPFVVADSTLFAFGKRFEGGGLKWTRTTDLALIRRAL